MVSQSRRQFVKRAGIGTVGIATGMAGCLGQDGGVFSGSGDNPTITHVSFPINIPWNEYLDRNGIYEERLDEAGYDFELQYSFEDPALFASGQAQIAMLSVLEASRLGIEREQEVTVAGRMMTVNYGMLVRAGSEYDPAETGSAEASIDRIASDGSRVAILGWQGGDVPAHQVIMTGLFDKDFSEGGDFDVISADPQALPQFLEDGEVDMISSGAAQGSHEQMMNEEFVPLYWAADEIYEQGWGYSSLIDVVTSSELAEDHPDAVRAFMEAYEEGVNWFFESGLDEIPGDEDYMAHYSTTDPEIAEYTVRWVQNREDVTAGFESDLPQVWENTEMTDEWIEGTDEYMSRAVELGQADENWRDAVSFADL